MRRVRGDVGRHAGRKELRFSIDREFQLTFQHMAPLLVEMAVFGQYRSGIDREMPESLLLRMPQRTMDPVPDFDYFVGFEIDERHCVGWLMRFTGANLAILATQCRSAG